MSRKLASLSRRACSCGLRCEARRAVGRPRPARLRRPGLRDPRAARFREISLGRGVPRSKRPIAAAMRLRTVRHDAGDQQAGDRGPRGPRATSATAGRRPRPGAQPDRRRHAGATGARTRHAVARHSRNEPSPRPAAGDEAGGCACRATLPGRRAGHDRPLRSRIVATSVAAAVAHAGPRTGSPRARSRERVLAPVIRRDHHAEHRRLVSRPTKISEMTGARLPDARCGSAYRRGAGRRWTQRMDSTSPDGVYSTTFCTCAS